MEFIPDKIPTSLSVVKDSYTGNAEAFFNGYALNNYKLTFEGLKIKFKDLENCMNDLQSQHIEFENHHFPISMFYDFYLLESKDFLITFDSYDNKRKVLINLYFQSYKSVKPLFDIIQKYQDKDDELFVSIFSFYQDQSKNIKSTEAMKTEEEFSKNDTSYYPYLNTEEMFNQYIMSDSNILLLCGQPGTGKTKLGDSFMKYLLEKCEPKLLDTKSLEPTLKIEEDIMGISEGIQVAYVKDESLLARDEFWNDLKENEYHLVFLDDLDYGLLPRSQDISSGVELEKNKFISNLLSFTDGIFESGNKTKFVITTNRPIGDIDTAVLRKGRTFDILELRELTYEEAKGIWLKNELEENKFISNFGKDGKILQADLGSTIKMLKKAKENNINLNPYITEEGISLYSEAKNHKKMGF